MLVWVVIFQILLQDWEAREYENLMAGACFRVFLSYFNSNNVSQLTDHCTNVDDVCLSVANFSYYRHPPACTHYLKHIKYMCLSVLNLSTFLIITLDNKQVSIKLEVSPLNSRLWIPTSTLYSAVYAKCQHPNLPQTSPFLPTFILYLKKTVFSLPLWPFKNQAQNQMVIQYILQVRQHNILMSRDHLLAIVCGVCNTVQDSAVSLYWVFNRETNSLWGTCWWEVSHRCPGGNLSEMG